MINQRIEAVKGIIEKIKNDRNNWRLSYRRKNREFLMSAGMDEDEIFDYIYNHLNYTNCISGPEEDNHEGNIYPGEIWIFGMKINNYDCYLKVQLKPKNQKFWISLHEANFKLNYEFR